jgi:peptidoglycan hydrolase-like protein with peptidoglycan-binding domain
VTSELDEAILWSLEDIIATAPTPAAVPTFSTVPHRLMNGAEPLGPTQTPSSAVSNRLLRGADPVGSRHRWARSLLAAAAAIIVIGGVSVLTRRSNVVSVGSVPTAMPEVSTLLDPSSDITADATATTVATATTSVPKTVLSRTLSRGLPASEDVRVMQQRLNDLHFDVGTVDGIFGTNTEMAVWVYQSLILNLSGKDVTGKVTPELWDRMQESLELPVFRPDASSTHAEIFLPAQAMVLYVNKELRLITHVSSGSGQKWCDEFKNVPAWPGATTTTVPPGQKNPRYCGTSITPGGVFKVYLKRDGWIDIPLGRVFNAISFNAGIAIHGYPDVPKNPASHGCVRVPMHIAQYLPDLLHRGDQIFVWDGVKEPEVYGDQKPPADERDPTDTTVVTTTIAPTTSAPTTTTPKPTTTTAAATTTTVKSTTTGAIPSVTSVPALPTPSSSVAPVASAAPSTAPAPPST